MSLKDKNTKFTHDQIENLIDFVKTHKALYVNPRDVGKRSLRENLWNKLGRNINKSPELCRKKFKDLRDRFVRKLKRDKPAQFRTHFKNMMFLLEIHPELRTKAERANTISDGDDVSNCSDASSMDDFGRVNGSIDFVDVPSSVEPSESINNKNNRMPTTDIFEVSEIDRFGCHSAGKLSASPPDVLDKFLLGLGATIRTFPDMDIAKVKLELSTIVFNKEMELTANRAKQKDCCVVKCECNCHTAAIA